MPLSLFQAFAKTSLTATAIRYAELTEDAVAVVISTGPTIDFCFLSETMKALPQRSWLRKGTPLPKNTATALLSEDARRVAKGERADAKIDITDWLGGTRSVRATEEVIGLGRYGKSLTVLTCPSIQDESCEEEEGESDDDLIEKWTPRFRR